jgi:hypothetical protein
VVVPVSGESGCCGVVGVGCGCGGFSGGVVALSALSGIRSIGVVAACKNADNHDHSQKQSKQLLCVHFLFLPKKLLIFTLGSTAMCGGYTNKFTDIVPPPLQIVKHYLIFCTEIPILSGSSGWFLCN